MELTRVRDLLVAAVGLAAVGYLLVTLLYRWFPPITVGTGVSLALIAAAEAGWGVVVRRRIADGRIGNGAGRLHPLAVARSVTVAKASAWLGAAAGGWWLGVLGFLLPRRAELRVARADSAGAVVALSSALALVVAALWLQRCCTSPPDPHDDDRTGPH